ncbi:MAG TPA: ATP-binding cassette domain-containing protein [Acidimicrobiales bacterium]|nr:ATP-binding cassette domain-containing protein [Acidimicrobiales bacterium]
MYDANEYHETCGPITTREPVAAPAAVRTKGLVRRFGAVTAVDGLDLEVRPGEIYGFLGPNGAGKSTLLRVLCTLLRPSAGQAVVAGHDVVEEPQQVRLRIGVALQEAALDDRQDGRELLVLQGRLYGLTSPEIRRRLDDVLDLVDIGDAIDRRIGTYSGGMKRRLDLAAALIHNPEVLFLDEPTTGLDPTSRAGVWSEVRRLNADLGMTIFLTTQYLDEADALADRVGIISRGRLVAEGPPDVLKRSMGQDMIIVETEGTDTTALDTLRHMDVVDGASVKDETITIRTSDSSVALNSVVIALSRTGLKVKSLALRTPTLDDVFAELTGSHIDVSDVR